MPVRARVYLAATITGGTLLLAWNGGPPSPDQLPEFIGLVLARVVASAFKLPLPIARSRSTISVSFVFDFTSLLLLGVQPTLLIAAVGALSQSTVHAMDRNPPYRVLFNVACLVITAYLTAVVYDALGGTTGRLTSLPSATPLAAALLVYFLVNSASLSFAVALVTNQRVSEVWHYNFLWGAPTYFIGGSLAAFLADAIRQRSWGFMPIAAVQLYVTYHACKVYVQRLQEEQRHRDVVAALHEGMSVLDGDDRVVLWNDALAQITGVPREQALRRRLVDLLPPLGTTTLPATVDRVRRHEHAETLEKLALPCVGGSRVLTIRLVPFADGVTMFWMDVTDRLQAESALRRSEERYALAAAAANDGLWDWDVDRDEIYVSPRWRTMLGLPVDTTVDGIAAWFERLHPEDLVPFIRVLNAQRAGDETPFQHEHRTRHADGSYRWMLCRGVAVRNQAGRTVRLAGSQTDITDRVHAQDELRHAALHDSLTGLPNRALFAESLSRAFERAERDPEYRFAVLFLDVDGFKVVNDTFGHAAGDALLVGIARRLASSFRVDDLVSRLGGDEFTVLLNPIADRDEATAIAERTLQVVQSPFALEACTISTSVSIGVAVSGPRYTRPHDLLRDADGAMYRAKELGKARHHLFEAPPDRPHLASDQGLFLT